MRKWLKDVDAYVFGWGSPVTMGAFRLIVGLLAFANQIMVGLDLRVWFGESGLYPAWMAERWAAEVPRLSILGGVTDQTVVFIVYHAVTLVALLVALGLWSRVTTALLFIGVVSLHHRSPDILHSGDTLLRAWLFILMLMPSGKALSLDRWLLKRKGLAPAVPLDVSLWPQRLAQIQLAVVYFSTVWVKWGGDYWQKGIATYFAPRLDEFHKFPTPGFVHEIPFVHFTTYATLIVELALATLVFSRPFRKWVLISGLMLHGWIEYSMNIPLFQWVIVAGFITHYDGEELSAWAKRLAPRLGKLGRLMSPADTPSPHAS